MDEKRKQKDEPASWATVKPNMNEEIGGRIKSSWSSGKPRIRRLNFLVCLIGFGFRNYSYRVHNKAIIVASICDSNLPASQSNKRTGFPVSLPKKKKNALLSRSTNFIGSDIPLR